MEMFSEQQLHEEAPFYIRWSPDRSPYAIELKLELVGKIAKELAEAETAGIEVGGVLIGTFPKAHMPILRVDDLEMIPRRPEDGPVYMLDPDQHERFTETQWKARARNKVTVGFFRSHIRPGPLRPSLADRSLLSGQFSQSVYVVLLVQAREPRTAGLFVAVNGELADEPSVREFRFDDAELKTLPEIQPNPEIQEEEFPASAGGARQWVKPLAIPLLIAIGILAILWIGARTGLFQLMTPAAGNLELAVKESDHVVRISWNHHARDIDRASSGTLIIADGSTHREIKLGRDELRLGVVDYQPNTQQIQVTMTLERAPSLAVGSAKLQQP